jgi:tetratricopeptide (TPR) repeat protein
LEHPNVATTLNNLAGLLESTNRLSEAEPLYRRALKIDEASYGPDHPTVAIRLNNLAGLLRSTNRLNEAEPLYRRALEIFVKFTVQTGHEHPHLRAAIGNYLDLLVKSELSRDAIRVRIGEILEPLPNELRADIFKKLSNGK